MKKSIIDLMLDEQKYNGSLSIRLECEAERIWIEVIDKLESIVTEDKHLLCKLNDSVIELLGLYEKNGYEAGFKDGIKTMKEIEALN